MFLPLTTFGRRSHDASRVVNEQSQIAPPGFGCDRLVLATCVRRCSEHSDAKFSATSFLRLWNLESKLLGSAMIIQSIVVEA